MKKITLLSGATAILTALSVPAFAQTEIATGAGATGVADVNDGITDIEDAVEDSFERSADPDRFGPSDRRQGLFGNMSLSYTGRTGNTENQDFALAGRLQHNQAPFAQSIGLAIEFGEDDDGNKDKEEVSAIYDAQYYFNDRFYAFALGRINIDGLVDGYDNTDESVRDFDEDDDLRRDGFLGFGPGYRVINTDTTTWRVQAGVGVRYTQTGLQHLQDESETEVGYIASSRVYHRFNETVFVTNDTDYLTSSEGGDVLTNEFGVNFKMSDQLATRLSYTTEYQSDREIRTDNTLGVAVVYGF
ncbi:DUF481 domain-containing protein [Paracoccus saliphilus]|uniref:DUF481 domain-containing protein n=1 Tax=Paracoccus saliphilus TaxID=405559 RepID=A0AA45W3T2_9RHOB|nr:DUF481 domain-containing protein [Paracoccus saliphilus]WCR04317.1 DUF481 domain-containing protein [Paracoccus saliphilus]SIS79644.1 putative salt-induced outer membrane protein [Paracoccus saliphilus]